MLSANNAPRQLPDLRSARRSTAYDILQRVQSRKALPDSEDPRRLNSPGTTSSARSNLSNRPELRSRQRRLDAAETITEGSDFEDVHSAPNNSVSSVINSQRARYAAQLAKNRRERCGSQERLILNLPMQDASLAPPGPLSTAREQDSSESLSNEIYFPPIEPIPLRNSRIREAEKNLRAFSQVAREDRAPAAGAIPPQRYFYGRRAHSQKPRIIKLKVVNLGPDTPNLQLPAYMLRLIQLVKHRRSRLQQINAGSCMFRHENKTILEHELKVYETALKNAFRMVKDVTGGTTTFSKPHPHFKNVLATRSVRPVINHPLMQERPMEFKFDEFMADMSISGVSDLFSTSNSEITSELEEEVEELRKSLKKVREDIAYILEEEEDEDSSGEREPPIRHIRAIRQCSIHSIQGA